MPKKQFLSNTIKVSVHEGIYAQIFLVLAMVGGAFTVKLATELEASNLQLGILAAIGQFAQVFQPLGSYVTHNLASRKGKTISFALWGRGTAFLFGVIPFLFYQQAGFFSKSSGIWIFLVLCLISAGLQAVSVNMWVAWISDGVPLRIRGRFFSIRTQFLTLAGTLAGYLFGFFIDLFAEADKRGVIASWFIEHFNADPWLNHGNIPFGFLILFSVAGGVGLYSLKLLRNQPERPKIHAHDALGEHYRAPFRDRNFRKLILFVIWWMLAIGIGSPFWVPFMLKKLQMGMVEVQIYGTCSLLMALLFIRPWGRFIDRFGNRTAMAIIICFSSLAPLPWLFVTPETLWLIYAEGAYAGAIYAGLGIVTTNFVLSIAPRGMQQSYAGFYAAFGGLGMMTTQLLSGFQIPPESMELFGKLLQPEQLLFALSGVARFTTLIPLLLIYEKRSVSLRGLLEKRNKPGV